MTENKDNRLLLLKDIKLLYVEDDSNLRDAMINILRCYFLNIYIASDGIEGLEKFIKNDPDIVVTDVKMPGMDGIQMSFEIKRRRKDVPIVVTTAFTEIPDLLNAIEAGVDRYIQKPVNMSSFMDVLYSVSLPVIQKEQIRMLQRQSSLENWYFGKNQKMKQIFEQAKSVAWSPFSVVLRGETGSGKSFLARVIHDMSNRKDQPFIKIDLGTMPENLMESELFGYEKGAFTGADRKRKGVVESANGGTIFLDELENASLHFQTRLLRVVEEKEIVPIGSNLPVKTDVRIISATNRNLYDLVKKGQFREDLYYRLAEFEIFIPPLRERKDDIPWLAARFMVEASDELKKCVYDMSSEAKEYILSFPWYGNVRELRNYIRRAVLFSKSSVISIEDMCKAGMDFSHESDAVCDAAAVFKTLAENERDLINKALNLTDGNKTRAARLLGIDITTLRRKIKKHDPAQH
ncbi:MAG TPA: sigma-54 dependent transcriptional regulator [bacterium]|nr:sigma-54 dependent transcriptional regulator [bacterium]HPS29308.1 sigma-54 dependent transcriptional regulator [bacterium]